MLAGIGHEIDRLRKTFPFDLIHAHFTYPDGWVATELGARLGVPAIITEHASWRAWSDDEPEVLRRAISAVRNAAAHVSVGTALRDEIRRLTGSDANLHVIPLGVDGTVFRLPNRGKRKKPSELLFVGAVRPVKGLDILIRALGMIAKRGRPETLRVIGDNYFSAYAKARRDAESLARELGLQDRVTFSDGMAPEDLARAMQESAVLVSPSRRETLGMVMVEALACGTPVVATQSGGASDIMTSDVGRIVPTEDPLALADAIMDVVDRHEEFSAERLHEHAMARFSWNHVVDSYLQLYRQVLREGPTGCSAQHANYGLVGQSRTMQ